MQQFELTFTQKKMDTIIWDSNSRELVKTPLVSTIHNAMAGMFGEAVLGSFYWGYEIFRLKINEYRIFWGKIHGMLGI